MKSYEYQYLDNLGNILVNDKREYNQRTGVGTDRLPFTQIYVDLSKEFPILTTKKVFWQSAADEILWIMQKQSNKTSELNSKIWNQWTGKDGTIGKAYGYQVGQPTRGYANQVEYVLETLKKDPSNRQCVINMWNVSQLEEMNLVPCAFSSIWSIIDDKLNCMLVQRSADYPVGVPFNTTQYAILTHLFARHLGVDVGMLTHVMADSHIYENQIEGVEEQLSRNPVDCCPKFVWKTDKTNFWDMTLEDFDIEDYSPHEAIKYEVTK